MQARAVKQSFTTSVVARPEKLVEDGTRLKNSLHEHLVTPYPSYNKFFCQLQSKSAMYFYYNYPSPIHLKNKSKDELFKELKLIASNTQMSKIELILDTIESDGYTNRDYQEKRDFITRSLIRDLDHQIEELTLIIKEIELMLYSFDYKLTTMPYVSTAVASRLIAEIGDISHFSNADKLARFAGIATVKFSSAGKGKEQALKQGNRKLNGLFYFLVVSMVCVDSKGMPKNPVFYEYYQRKISEGKTKTQALVCIKRRLVNIIYGMMKTKRNTFHLLQNKIKHVDVLFAYSIFLFKCVFKVFQSYKTPKNKNPFIYHVFMI